MVIPALPCVPVGQSQGDIYGVWGARSSPLGKRDTNTAWESWGKPWGLRVDWGLSLILLKRDGGGLVSLSNFLESSAPDLVKNKHTCAEDKKKKCTGLEGELVGEHKGRWERGGTGDRQW